jgi:putative membrane protein
MWNGFEGMGWGWIGLGMVHMLLFWAFVILAIVAIVKWLTGGTAPFDQTRAIDILKARYAKGELTREQFERMKRELAD